MRMQRRPPETDETMARCMGKFVEERKLLKLPGWRSVRLATPLRPPKMGPMSKQALCETPSCSNHKGGAQLAYPREHAQPCRCQRLVPFSSLSRHGSM